MTAKTEFIHWLKNNDPFLYEVGVERYKTEQAQNGLAGIGDFFSSLVSTVKDVAPTIIEVRNSKKILDTNLKRAQQNLPPINPRSYEPSVPPEQATPSAVKAVAQSTGRVLISKAMLPVALGGGALLIYLLLKKRR